MTPTREEIEHAFSLVAGLVEPATRGEARDQDVIAARDAMQALYLLRQWARAGAVRPPKLGLPPPPPRPPPPPPIPDWPGSLQKSG